MKILGLTGGISCGKSTIARMLKELGANIIDTDKIAHELAEIGEPLYLAYLEHFGEDILLEDKKLNRREIAIRIYNDPNEREWINSVAHPIIRQRVEEEISRLKETGAKSAVLDAPLLFEVGWQNYADVIWVAYVNRQLQIKRLKKRDRIGRANAEKRLNAQMPIEEKKKLADVVICNENGLEELRQEVSKAWSEFCQSLD